MKYVQYDLTTLAISTIADHTADDAVLAAENKGQLQVPEEFNLVEWQLVNVPITTYNVQAQLIPIPVDSTE